MRQIRKHGSQLQSSLEALSPSSNHYSNSRPNIIQAMTFLTPKTAPILCPRERELLSLSNTFSPIETPTSTTGCDLTYAQRIRRERWWPRVRKRLKKNKRTRQMRSPIISPLTMTSPSPSPPNPHQAPRSQTAQGQRTGKRACYQLGSCTKCHLSSAVPYAKRHEPSVCSMCQMQEQRSKQQTQKALPLNTRTSTTLPSPKRELKRNTVSTFCTAQWPTIDLRLANLMPNLERERGEHSTGLYRRMKMELTTKRNKRKTEDK